MLSSQPPLIEGHVLAGWPEKTWRLSTAVFLWSELCTETSPVIIGVRHERLE
jgi:hypothetical protein